VLERGATLDQWRVLVPVGGAPAPAVGAALPPRLAVDALVDTVATLRVSRWLAAGALGPVRRTLRFAIDAAPASGAQPSRRVIELGAPGPAGRCAARIDAADVVELPVEACRRLAARLAR